MPKAARRLSSPNGPTSASSTSTCRAFRALSWPGESWRAMRPARIIMFSMNDDPIFAARAIETGAKGYVSKSGDPGDLVEAIRKVGEGGVFLPSAIAQSIAFAGPGFAENRLAKLTQREIEILRLLGAGKSLSEIAWLVHSSYKTIANTSSIMRQKLGLRSSSELVRFAIESRLV